MKRLKLHWSARPLSYLLSIAMLGPALRLWLGAAPQARAQGLTKSSIPSWAVLDFSNTSGYGGPELGRNASDAFVIELGKTNIIDTVRFGLYPNVYKAFWELYNFSQGANPAGYSLSQRLEFWKTARNIIKSNFWFGVGTGDVKKSFEKQYVIDRSQLPLENRLRAHNQLITFFLAFGFIGFLVIVGALIAAPVLARKFNDYLFVSIFVISFLSFINEDTLESHHGISFVAFFYALFLFSKLEKTKDEVTSGE